MPANQFESSRIAEGTMHAGARHIRTAPDPQVADASNVYSIEEGEIGTPSPRHFISAAELSDYGVKNPMGEDLGRIEEIMLDPAGGRIAYLVLSLGGFLGIGNKSLIVPWTALTVDEIGRKLILDATRADLENAPGFGETDDTARPDMTDPEFARRIHHFYGRTPYWESTLTDFGGDEYSANRSRH